MGLFTDRLLANLKPREKRYVVWEPNHRRLGTLGVRVAPSGRRTWIYMYRSNDRARMATLGLYPQMSVAQAHAAAAAMLEALEYGRDPARERVIERVEIQRSPTVARLVEDYIERYAKKRKRTWKNDKLMLDKHLVPRLGHLKVGEVRRRDVIGMLEEVAAKTPTSANRLLEVVRKMFNWAVERELVESNPCWRVSRPARESSRDRVLSPGEIRRLWEVLDQEQALAEGDDTAETGAAEAWITRPLRLGYKLALVTAQRRSEVTGAARTEFDLDARIWTIPAERTKNGKKHRVPLSDLAVSIIQELAEQAGDSPWLFPSPWSDGKTHITADALSRAVAKLRKRVGSEHFNVHDLRRTAASHMAQLRFDRTVIKKVLNHTDPDVTAIYDRYSYDAEKRAALDAWAQQLLVIVSAKRAEFRAVA